MSGNPDPGDGVIDELVKTTDKNDSGDIIRENVDLTKSLKKKDKYSFESKNNSYKIIIENKNKNSENNKYISLLKVAELIHRIVPNQYENDHIIKKINKNQITVAFKDLKLANNVIDDDRIEKMGYNAYIPFCYISKAAVIRNVDVEFDENTLKNNIKCHPYNVLKVERFSKRVTINNEIKFVPSETCKVFFGGQDLPKYLSIWNVRFECDPYIRKIRQCLNCLRYGHIKRNCKGLERCMKCGVENHISVNCESNKLKCINCKREHSANYPECPERMRQLNINVDMGLKNLTFAEANIENPRTYANDYLYSVQVNNTYDLLQNYNENFPNFINEDTINVPSYIPDKNKIINQYKQNNRIKFNKTNENNINKNKRDRLRRSPEPVPLSRELKQSDGKKPRTELINNKNQYELHTRPFLFNKSIEQSKTNNFFYPTIAIRQTSVNLSKKETNDIPGSIRTRRNETIDNIDLILNNESDVEMHVSSNEGEEREQNNELDEQL